MKNGCEIEFFNIFRFLGAISIAVFLHYDYHFLGCLGVESAFLPSGFWMYLSKESAVFVGMYFIISGILFAMAYKDKIGGGYRA